MSAKDFELLSEFIGDHCGIKMPLAKKALLESRLQKRLRTLGLASFHDYYKYLVTVPEGAGELLFMIDAVTTNKTDFFREPVHFTFLTETVLHEFLVDRGRVPGQQFTAWSAGCSSGEEPYTLAIILSEFALRNPGFQFTIWATDISANALDKARLGIYDEGQIAMIPTYLKRKYFMRSKDRDKGTVRVVPALRSVVKFQRINLMDDNYSIPEASIDALFCRNVMIYFERSTQYRLLRKFCRYLRKGEHLFLGHSETVQGFDLPLARIASTIYRKTQ